MLAAPLRSQYTPPVLARLKQILAPSPQGPRTSHYRLSANTVWYDAARIGAPDDPMTFLELIMDSTADPVQIVSLSFRGRIGREREARARVGPLAGHRGFCRQAMYSVNRRTNRIFGTPRCRCNSNRWKESCFAS